MTRFFSNYHPTVLVIYFAAMLLTVMLTTNPILLIEALIGGGLFACTVFSPKKLKKNAVMYTVLALIITVTNPIFSHNGSTVLFTVGNTAVTSQSLLYGGSMALTMTDVLIWCDLMSNTLTDDKFMYLFGKTVPKLSLVLSGALRSVPLIIRRIKKVNDTQKAMGLYCDTNKISAIKNRGEVLRTVISWSLENTIDTSFSMSARGYGLHKRTNFSLFTFGMTDGVTATLILLLCALTFIGMGCGVTEFVYYPKVYFYGFTAGSITVYSAFILFSLIPFITEIGKGLKWKYCVSKI